MVEIDLGLLLFKYGLAFIVGGAVSPVIRVLIAVCKREVLCSVLILVGLQVLSIAQVLGVELHGSFVLKVGRGGHREEVELGSLR